MVKNEKRPGLRLGKQEGISGEIKSLHEVRDTLEIAECEDCKIVRIGKDPNKVYYITNKSMVVDQMLEDVFDYYMKEDLYGDESAEDFTKRLADVVEALYKICGKKYSNKKNKIELLWTKIKK